MSNPVGPFKHDYLITYDATDSLYKAISRLGTVAYTGATTADAVVESAIASQTNRATSILFDRSVGVCPSDVFPFSSPIIMGQDTIIEGMGDFQRFQSTEGVSPFSCRSILDFSANDITAITNANNVAYRPHQWKVRDLTILGGSFFGANKAAAIALRNNPIGPVGQTFCGLVDIERVEIDGFYTGVDFGGALGGAGGGQNCRLVNSQIKNAVFGAIDGNGSCLFDDTIFYNLQNSGFGGDTPVGLVINGARTRVRHNKFAVTCAQADLIHVVNNGAAVAPWHVVISNNEFGYGSSDLFTNGIKLINAQGAIIHDNTMESGLTGESIWVTTGASYCDVHHNTIPKEIRDDNSGANRNALGPNMIFVPTY